MNVADPPYMLDTTEFNRVLKEKISTASFAGYRLLVTGIQVDELRATKDSKRRTDLLAVFEEINPATELASSAAWGIEGAGWGQAYWNDGSGKFEKMLQRLQKLDPKSKEPHNQLRDILIAETSIKKNAILVSRDENLRKVVSEFGGQAIDRLPL
jgi:predicted nucleic acid-binding protein